LVGGYYYSGNEEKQKKIVYFIWDLRGQNSTTQPDCFTPTGVLCVIVSAYQLFLLPKVMNRLAHAPNEQKYRKRTT